MPEKVFKSRSIVELTQKVNIAVPHHKSQEELDYEEAQEEYKGPSIEEIELERNLFKMGICAAGIVSVLLIVVLVRRK